MLCKRVYYGTHEEIVELSNTFNDGVIMRDGGRGIIKLCSNPLFVVFPGSEIVYFIPDNEDIKTFIVTVNHSTNV